MNPNVKILTHQIERQTYFQIYNFFLVTRFTWKGISKFACWCLAGTTCAWELDSRDLSKSALSGMLEAMALNIVNAKFLLYFSWVSIVYLASSSMSLDQFRPWESRILFRCLHLAKTSIASPLVHFLGTQESRTENLPTKSHFVGFNVIRCSQWRRVTSFSGGGV